MFKRLRIAAVGLGLVAATAMPAFSQGTLRIGMTAADIPQTTGQPDQGFEGFRFAGYTIYDALVNWDLSKADTIADIRPGLATEWSAVEGEPTKWIFKLRQGVKFHDGSDFDADVVVWNLEKILNDKSPQFDPKQAAQARARIPTLVGWKAVDKYTVELTTRVVNALFPYDMSYIFYSSPTNWEKQGKDWVKVALQPVRHRPVQGRSRRAARAHGAVAQRRLLGQGARSQARQGAAVPDAGGRDPHRRAAGGPGRLDRGAGARRHPAPEAGRHGHRHQQVPAQLGLPAQHGRRLAVDRHPRAQGGQPRHRSRRPQQAAGRHDDRVQGRGLSRPSLVRRAVLRHQVRSGGGQEAAGRGRLQRHQEAQDQDRDLDLGLGPDAAAADERVRAGEPECRGLRRPVRGHGMECAGHLRLPAGDRRGRHQGPASTASTSAAPRSIPTRPSCGSIIRASCRRAAPTGAS